MAATVVVWALIVFAQAPAAQPPPDWEATHARAYADLSEGRAADAVARLERAVAAAPEFAQAHLVLAEVLVDAAGRRKPDAPPPTAAERRLLERAATHYERAGALDASLQDIVALSLSSVYDESGLDDQAQVEKVARILVARRPEAVIWHMLLADALVRQGRWSAVADALLAADATRPADERLPFGMVLADYANGHPEMPLDEARRLLGAADAIAGEAIAAAPGERDGWKLRAGAIGMLAERLPEGAERARLQAESTRAFDRFMELNPNRAAGGGEIAFVEAPPLPPPPPPPPPSPPGSPPPAAPPSTEATRRIVDDGLVQARLDAAARPDDDLAQVSVAAHLWEVARDAQRPEPERQAAVTEGLAALDVVLARSDDHLEATVYRSLLLRQAASMETTPARRDALIAEATALRQRAEAIRERRQATPP